MSWAASGSTGGDCFPDAPVVDLLDGFAALLGLPERTDRDLDDDQERE